MNVGDEMTIVLPQRVNSGEPSRSWKKFAGTRSITLSLILCLYPAVIAVFAQSVPPFRDPGLPIETRVNDLLKRMTLEEKASQMTNASPAIPRLGIPAYNWWSEGLHGLARSGYATVFPQAIGMAATWDPSLLHLAGDVTSSEARVRYKQAQASGDALLYRGLTIWSPNINIFRDPRWGRGQETYGEDPFLTAQLGVAYIRGLQGDDPRFLKTVATAKHFAVHSGPESLRHSFNAAPNKQDLESTYLPAFRAAVEQGHAGSLMCSYNAVFDEPACANDLLLNQQLRQSWGFRGYVVSDCGAIGDIEHGHHKTGDLASAAALAVKEGTDLDCGEEYRQLPAAVTRGLISEQEIDRNLARLLTARFRLGMFDPPGSLPWDGLTAADIDSEPHRQLALRAAEESLVLLKNSKKLLPLQAARHHIAVIGPDADCLECLEGNYNGTPKQPVTVVDGFRAAFGDESVEHRQGSIVADGVALPVPSYELPEHDGLSGGFNVEFFLNDSLTGQPVTQRHETRLDFDWRQAAPVPEVSSRGFAVRWSGVLIPTIDGNIPLGIRRGECWDCSAQDDVKLYVNDEMLVEDNGSNKDGATTLTAVRMQKGIPLRLRVEYVVRSGNASLSLVWIPPGMQVLEEAVSAVKRSDLVVLVLGISPQLEGEEMPIKVPGFDGGDRTTLDLPQPQKKLFDAIAKTGKPIVLVLMNGSPLALHTMKDRATAILESWYPGEEGGTAIARALDGRNNPSGRLPLTFYLDTSDLPAFADYSMNGRTYRYFSRPVLYPFGYGLSYTKFAYSNGACRFTGTDTLHCGITVSNRGEREGDEVVQLYLPEPLAPGEAHIALGGFTRIHLKSGEDLPVSIEVPATFLAPHKRLNKPARIWIGSGQPFYGLPGAFVDVSPAGNSMSSEP